ncbi:MAG TPA: class I SAM-dependent methyltransferase [Solirubrobacteraceae bacterium]|nr:class I SAM-dependent methyltransferase [Solirubrobacteraceae bacterium]
MNLEPFVAAHLPAAPARVLEIGCGSGALAHAMARLGHDVLAVDPSAPEGDLFRRVTLEELADPGPFDAVVASRSLHHIHDLPAALDKVAALLAPGGLLLLHEHAWDRIDEPTQRWYREQGGSGDWRAEHEQFHGYEAIHTELARRFSERHLEWTPYLHGALHIEPDVERRAIEAGEIRATGFLYVGERRSRTSAAAG